MTRISLTQLLANAAPAPTAAKPQAQPKGSPPEPVIPLDEAGTGEGLPADEEEPFDPDKEIDPKFSKRAAKVMNSAYWTAGIETAEEYRARAAEKAKLSDALTTARTFKELPAEAQVSFRKAEAKVGKKPGEDEDDEPVGNALDLLLNAFCPTGPGGGVDPTCSPGGTGGRANRPELVGKSRDAISDLITSGGKATAEQISEAISSLKQITVKDIEALRKEHSLTGTKARKDERIAALIAQASARVSDKEKVTREARAAGVKPAEVFALADDMHEQAKEHNALTAKMLKEARDQFKSEGGGKRLTRNHPAFKGGDPSQIKGFDKVARIMARRYPELLGAHGYEEGSHESASGKLFDYLAAGTPKLPPKSHWHRQAIEYLHEKKRLAREEVPF